MKTILPETAVPLRVAYSGALGALLAFLSIWLLRPTPLLGTLILLTACAAPMWRQERSRHRNRTPNLTPPSPAVHRLRIFGLGGATALFTITIGIQHVFSAQWITGLYNLAFPLCLLAPAWAVWYLRRRSDPSRPDSIEALGVAITRLHKPTALSDRHTQTILAWCVKSFFLPLMLSWTYSWVSNGWVALEEQRGGMQAFAIAMAVLYAIDTAFGTIGYLSTSEKIGAHIRSVDKSWAGWTSALVCYPPLNLVVLHQWLSYKDGHEWQDWLGAESWLGIAWGSGIIFMTAVYVWSTVVFGPRFSNLTNRGIITSGPFRYTKHPAYISKNISWWMISIPFISNSDTGTAIANSAGLIGINVIYWIRAKTEEKHLTQDPTYRDYCAWIQENGIFSRHRIFSVKSKY